MKLPMPPESVSKLYGRSRGVCEFPGCTDAAQVIHHRKGRGFPGCHAPELLAHLCEPHHIHVHAHPAESRANGLMVSRHAPVAPHVRDGAA